MKRLFLLVVINLLGLILVAQPNQTVYANKFRVLRADSTQRATMEADIVRGRYALFLGDKNYNPSQGFHTQYDARFDGKINLNGSVGINGQVLKSGGSSNPSWGQLSYIDLSSKPPITTLDNWVNWGFGGNGVFTGNLSLNNVAMVNTFVLRGGKAIGNGAGNLMTNDVLGFNAFATNSTGNNNVAIGNSSMNASNSNFNTAVGASTMTFNTTGYENVALGYRAIYSNTTGHNITSIGAYSGGSGNYSIGIGYYGGAGSSGVENIAIGREALRSGVTGAYNVGIGSNVFYNGTSGNANVAIGKNAIQFGSTASQNIAIGENALANGTNGSLNIAIGNSALLNSNVTSSIAIGNNALGGTGSGLNNNIAIGNGAGSSNTRTGSYNIYFGGWDGTSSSGSFNMYFSDVLGNRRFTFNNSGLLQLHNYTTAGILINDVSGNVTSTNSITLSSLNVTGNTTIGGTLGVTGVTILKDVTINNATITPSFNYGINWGTNTEGGETSILTSGDGDLKFFVNSGIDGFLHLKASNGFLGVGKNNPDYRLDVYGDSRITGLTIIEDKLIIGAGVTSTTAALEVNSTTGALRVPRVTTAQRDAMSAEIGDIIYNTDTDEYQGYRSFGWSVFQMF